MIRVIIFAEIRLYREGLALALEADGRFRIVTTMSSVAQALATLPNHPADIILLDMATAGALDGLRDLAKAAPSAQLVALGLPDLEPDVIACAEAGIAGYVLRQDSLEDLISCLESAARSELRCSPRMAAALLRHLAIIAACRRAGVPGVRITDREQQVLSLVDQGLSNKQIASRLLIEVATVKNHIHNILEKLGAKRRGEAAALLRRAPRPRLPDGQLGV